MSEVRQEVGIDPALRIGAVARLTGLSVHTLRKWEDRYHAVSPTRSEGGERLYSQHDVSRLRLIRSLSSAGMSLRELAALDLESLEAAWEQVARNTPGTGTMLAAGRVARVAAVGPTAPRLLEAVASSHIEVVASAATPTELYRALEDVPIDVLVCELTTITADARSRIDELAQRTRANGLVVAYGYGARPTVDALRRRGLALLRAPLDVDALERAVVDVLAEISGSLAASVEVSSAAPVQAPPPPALSMDVIARVAESSPAVRCECPRHLADLLYGLRAFEEYSADCESRSPQDAELHRYLWETTGRARAMFEAALVRVARAEGIDLE